MLDYLIRCATAQARHASPLEQKKSGAGVGLFLTAMAASELLFRLWRGRLTEIVFANTSAGRGLCGCCLSTNDCKRDGGR